MDTSELILVLRLFHIVGGAFWFGAVVTTVFFVEPTAEALGIEGERFLAHLAIRRRLAIVTAIAATAAILAGAGLYWIDSGGLGVGWIETHTGLAFTVGGLAALAAYLIAFLFLKPYFDAYVRSTATTSAGREVDPGQHDELRRLALQAHRWGLVQVALLLLAVIAMAAARYIP